MTILKYILIGLALLVGVVVGNGAAFARDSYLDLSVNGNQQRNQYEHASETNETLGVEVGLPITQFFEISFGYTVARETISYDTDYSAYKRKEYANERCVNGTEVDIESCRDTYITGETFVSRKVNTDVTANVSFGYPIGLLYPSFFFGRLWRTTNVSDSILKTPDENNPTWNGGVALQVYLTYKLRFKASYRISPSSISTPSNRKFDTLTTLGFTYSL